MAQQLSQLAQTYSALYGRAVDPAQQVSVHSGGTEAILSIFTAFIEQGDEVIVMEPAFDLYELHTRFLGGVLRRARLKPPEGTGSMVVSADDWSFDIEEIEGLITPKTRMLVVNTPHNPLGKVFSADELRSLGKLCVKHGLIILSDEVYEHLHYGESFHRMATMGRDIARHTITVGSIGKSFNATGWRVGYAIGDAPLIKHVRNAHIVLSYTTAGPAQMAAALGLQQAEGNGFWQDYRQNMKRKIHLLCQTFEALGLPYVLPSGAHYVLVDVNMIKPPEEYPFPPGLEDRPRDWRICWFLIQEIGVISIPVSASFRSTNAPALGDYLRFVACKGDAELQLARDRLKGLKRFIRQA